MWMVLRIFSLLAVLLVALPARAEKLVTAVLAAARALPAPYAPPARAEAASALREAFLPVLAYGIVRAAEEATCEGPWSELECKRRWPGTTAQLASFTLMEGYFESKLDPEVQAGRCPVWGPRPTQIGCDGLLFPSGYAPPTIVGHERKTRWGLVVFTSNSVFQVKVSTNHRVKEIVGLGEMSVFEASREAVKIVCSSRSACRASASWPECTASNYAGTISFSQAPIRAAMYRKIFARVSASLDDASRPVQVRRLLAGDGSG